MTNNKKIIILTVRINELHWFLFLYCKTKLKENHMRFLISFFTKYIRQMRFIKNRKICFDIQLNCNGK